MGAVETLSVSVKIAALLDSSAAGALGTVSVIVIIGSLAGRVWLIFSTLASSLLGLSC